MLLRIRGPVPRSQFTVALYFLVCKMEVSPYPTLTMSEVTDVPWEHTEPPFSLSLL